jgi:hypothetical protein
LFVVGVAAGTGAFLAVAAVLTGHVTQDSLISAHGILVESPKSELTPKEMRHLSGLIQGGHVLTGQNLVSEISRYYNSVMTTLLVAFTGLGVVAFFSVRGLSLERAEDTAQQASRRQVDIYFNSQHFRDLAQRIIAEGTADLTDSLRQTLAEAESQRVEWQRWGPEELDQLQDRLVHIERRLSELDFEEQDSRSEHLVPPDNQA